MAAKKRFFARPGSHLKDKDAETLGRFVDQRFKGQASAEELVEAAAPAQSPVHEYFEWDDSIAGVQYRLGQARSHLGAIMVVIDRRGKEPVETRAFHNVLVTNSEPVRKYVSERIVWKAPDLAQQVTDQALRELHAWEQRWAQYKELAGLVERVSAAAMESAA